MKNIDIAELNNRFGDSKKLHFCQGNAGLTKVVLNYHEANLELYLQGAHITSYQPIVNNEILWMSEIAIYQPGKALRGGIPLCWPWFGAGREGRPQHGYARISDFSVLDTSANNQSTSITLTLETESSPYPEWANKARLEVEIKLSDSLWMEIRTRNNSEAPLNLTNALHSYYSISNRDNVTVPALIGLNYRDKLQSYQLVKQNSAILINKEVDRVYLNAPSSVELIDSGTQSRISIKTWGNKNLVVWNPDRNVARAMPDFDDQGFERMLCLEPANALDQTAEIKPGEIHWLGQEIKFEPHHSSCPNKGSSEIQ